MKTVKLFESRTETRKNPVNLLAKDFELFEQASSCHIGETYLMEFSRMSVLKDVLFSLRDLKFYPALSEVDASHRKPLAKKLKYLLYPTQKVEKGIWITDSYSSEYFHWLTDALPRLLAIEEAIVNQEAQPSQKEYQVVLPEGYRSRPYILESLEIFGYKACFYKASRRLKIKNLISVSHTAPTGNYNTEIIRKLRERLIKTLPGNKRKIYISRQKAAKRGILNEPEIIHVVTQYGYEVHYFEDYSLKEQISIMEQAKSLIGIHGAGLANMLFMPAGAQVLELRNGRDTHNNCFYSLASSLEHHYFYLSNKGDSEDTHGVNITVDVNQFRKTLELMENKRQPHD